MVYFCQPELPFDVGFCEVTNHILPMIFGLAGNGLDMKADLMCWMLEFRQGPKCFTADLPGRKSIDIVPDGVICHGTLHNIVGMGFACTTFCDEIQPFVRHFRETQDFQVRILYIAVDIHNTIGRTAVSPAVGLLIVVRAVESPRKVLCIPCDADFRIDNFFLTAVIQ